MRIQHESGLKILQVNHISPPWAAKDPTHFPDDLRDVYNFYRGLAKRWNGLADAIEPWNEPDLDIFGGHTGCEIASFQKAAFLGLKAGDPQRPPPPARARGARCPGRRHPRRGHTAVPPPLCAGRGYHP